MKTNTIGAPRSGRTKQVFTHHDNYYSALAWQVASSLLWNGARIHAPDQRAALLAIRFYFSATNHKTEAYEEFVQRIVYARIKCEYNNTDGFMNPATWFAPGNNDGFAGTAKWYKQFIKTQSGKPLSERTWLCLAHSVAQLTYHPAASQYHQWRSFFATHSQRTLNFFLAITRSVNKQPVYT